MIISVLENLECDQNYSMSKAFDFENFLLRLSKIHSQSKSTLAGHINIVEKDNLIAISRNISTESNFLFLFNTNSNNSVSIDKCTTHIRIQNAKSKVEYSNTGDISGDILFNDKNSPIIETSLCPYCSIIISWAFKPLDIEDIL